MPYNNSVFYEGPIARALCGTDISWVLGLVVAAGLYLMLVPRSKRAA